MLSKKDKKDKKKGKDDKEDDVFTSDFDKTDFSYLRLKNWPSPKQKEARLKFRSGGGSWNDRYVVLHCNYLIYYEPSRLGPPRDLDRPLGAIRMEDIVSDGIERLEKESSGGLLSKTHHYDHALTIPLVSGKKAALQFDTEEQLQSWYELLVKQSKNCALYKAYVAQLNPIALVTDLYNRYPQNPQWVRGPDKGLEEDWVAQVKVYYQIRQKHYKDLKKIQLYSEYYNAKTKAYIDWFVTRGGEGKASLEKDLTDVEEKVFDQWKKDVQHDLKTIEQEIAAATTTEAEKALHEKVCWRKREIELWYLFEREVFGRTSDTLAFEQQEWNKYYEITKKMIEDRAIKNKEEAERRRREAEEEFFRRQAELRRLEEERRNDPFSDLNKDEGDPFADVKVETL